MMEIWRQNSLRKSISFMSVVRPMLKVIWPVRIRRPMLSTALATSCSPVKAMKVSNVAKTIIRNGSREWRIRWLWRLRWTGKAGEARSRALPVFRWPNAQLPLAATRTADGHVASGIADECADLPGPADACRVTSSLRHGCIRRSRSSRACGSGRWIRILFAVWGAGINAALRLPVHAHRIAFVDRHHHALVEDRIAGGIEQDQIGRAKAASGQHDGLGIRHRCVCHFRIADDDLGDRGGQA